MLLRKKYQEAFFHDVTAFGGLTWYGLVTVIFLVLGNIDTSYRLVVGLILIYVVAILIRTFYFKYRPSLQKYSTLLQRLDASAFPSVHAARGTFMAFVFGMLLQNKVVWVIVGGVAVLVAASRVYLKEHDIVDVMGGVLLGLVIGVVVARFL